jgi:hypothetical protein
MQPLPPAACDVAAKVALLQGFYSMPKPLPAGARPRPASCHVATVSHNEVFFRLDVVESVEVCCAGNEICWTIILTGSRLCTIDELEMVVVYLSRASLFDSSSHRNKQVGV